MANALLDAGAADDSDVATEAQRQAAYEQYWADSDSRDELKSFMDMDYTIQPEFNFTLCQSHQR